MANVEFWFYVISVERARKHVASVSGFREIFAKGAVADSRRLFRNVGQSANVCVLYRKCIPAGMRAP